MKPIQYMTTEGSATTQGNITRHHGPYATLAQASAKARAIADASKQRPYHKIDENPDDWYSIDIDRTGSGIYDEFIYTRLASPEEMQEATQ